MSSLAGHRGQDFIILFCCKFQFIFAFPCSAAISVVLSVCWPQITLSPRARIINAHSGVSHEVTSQTCARITIFSWRICWRPAMQTGPLLLALAMGCAVFCYLFIRLCINSCLLAGSTMSRHKSRIQCSGRSLLSVLGDNIRKITLPQPTGPFWRRYFYSIVSCLLFRVFTRVVQG